MRQGGSLCEVCGGRPSLPCMHQNCPLYKVKQMAQVPPIDPHHEPHTPRDPLLVEREKTHDPVNHPTHYIQHPSGVECIQITEWMNFNLGNAVKYIWRMGLKPGVEHLQDLKKARWYLDREIKRLSK